jgi:uncharacterized membrane protein
VNLPVNPFDPKAALLAKHAQHVVLIHFPIALFLTGIAFDIAGRFTKNAAKKNTLMAAARLNLLGAAVAVLPTLATGIAAWQWQLAGQKLKGLLLLHLALGMHLRSSYLFGRVDPFSTAKQFH